MLDEAAAEGPLIPPHTTPPSHRGDGFGGYGQDAKPELSASDAARYEMEAFGPAQELAAGKFVPAHAQEMADGKFIPASRHELE